MSTGLECEFVEVKPGAWYYVLEHGSAPMMAWDWHEHASAYGPFATFEKAHDQLRRRHANPGGYSTSEYRHGFEPDETLAELVAEATL